jgi:hypothetical protein
VGDYGVLMYGTERCSHWYIRTPLRIGPGLCIMLEGNFREFLFYEVGCIRGYLSVCWSFEPVSGRNHKEAWAGCIVSLTTPSRSPLNACTVN